MRIPGGQCFFCLSVCQPVSLGNQSLSDSLETLAVLACWPLRRPSLHPCGCLFGLPQGSKKFSVALKVKGLGT